VDPTGADVPDCTVAASPCATIGFALSQASAGDTVLVAGGIYFESVVMETGVHLLGQGAIIPLTPLNSPAVLFSGTGPNTVLEGFNFSITEGASLDLFVEIVDSSAEVRKNVFGGANAFSGRAMAVTNSSVDGIQLLGTPRA